MELMKKIVLLMMCVATLAACSKNKAKCWNCTRVTTDTATGVKTNSQETLCDKTHETLQQYLDTLNRTTGQFRVQESCE
jgi:hypothetical protein